MRLFFLFLTGLCLSAALPSRAEEPPGPVFTYSLLAEPQSLDPQSASNASGNYLVHNMFRGLFRFDAKKGLVPEGAKNCTRSNPLRLVCHLNKKLKWSDGSLVVAEDYVRSFRRLIDPDHKSAQAELLLQLKNAHKIWAGKLDPSQLGIAAKDAQTLIFTFNKPDYEFEYKLVHPALSPLRQEDFPDKKHARQLLADGPYEIVRWETGHRVLMKPNPYYPSYSKKLPWTEALFIESDDAGLDLYESGRLSFLRRLPAAQIPHYRGGKDFYQIPMARFDYIGFSSKLKNSPELRKALSLSLDFMNFKKIFYAKGRPGCPSLPDVVLQHPRCLDFDLKKAKPAFAKAKWPKGIAKELGYSKMGGDDIARSAQWFQGQWKTHLGLSLMLRPEEQGMYLNTLQVKPPALFRKGVGLDRPTCLAALEVFAKKSPENYIRLDNPEYEKILDQMSHTANAKVKDKLCRKGLDILLGQHWIIPLGQIHFTMLASPKFTGWQVNQINQLELMNLRAVQPVKK